MREILFRGKRIDNGEWEYGYYMRYGWTGEIKDRIMMDGASALYAHEVDPATVGQYTGLVDKNGKKIFEGDIIRWKDWNGEYHEKPIKYDQEWNRFCVWTTGASSLGVNKHLSEEIEIIHDNPEMLR